MKRRRHLKNASQNKFIELLPNTETYKNSYFCRTVKDWNALPSEIVNIKPVDRFKKVLFEYFSGAPARTQRSTMGKKIWYTIHPRKFGYDVEYAHPYTHFM